jgi:dipeptidyl aminopeptidase/acylaminoacyl peptidase
VFTPDKAKGKKLPVLLFVHGGPKFPLDSILANDDGRTRHRW